MPKDMPKETCINVQHITDKQINTKEEEEVSSNHYDVIEIKTYNSDQRNINLEIFFVEQIVRKKSGIRFVPLPIEKTTEKINQQDNSKRKLQIERNISNTKDSLMEISDNDKYPPRVCYLDKKSTLESLYDPQAYLEQNILLSNINIFKDNRDFRFSTAFNDFLKTFIPHFYKYQLLTIFINIMRNRENYIKFVRDDYVNDSKNNTEKKTFIKDIDEDGKETILFNSENVEKCEEYKIRLFKDINCFTQDETNYILSKVFFCYTVINFYPFEFQDVFHQEYFRYDYSYGNKYENILPLAETYNLMQKGCILDPRRIIRSIRTDYLQWVMNHIIDSTTFTNSLLFQFRRNTDILYQHCEFIKAEDSNCKIDILEPLLVTKSQYEEALIINTKRGLACCPACKAYLCQMLSNAPKEFILLGRHVLNFEKEAIYYNHKSVASSLVSKYETFCVACSCVSNLLLNEGTKIIDSTSTLKFSEDDTNKNAQKVIEEYTRKYGADTSQWPKRENNEDFNLNLLTPVKNKSGEKQVARRQLLVHVPFLTISEEEKKNIIISYDIPIMFDKEGNITIGEYYDPTITPRKDETFYQIFKSVLMSNTMHRYLESLLGSSKIELNLVYSSHQDHHAQCCIEHTFSINITCKDLVNRSANKITIEKFNSFFNEKIKPLHIKDKYLLAFLRFKPLDFFKIESNTVDSSNKVISKLVSTTNKKQTCTFTHADKSNAILPFLYLQPNKERVSQDIYEMLFECFSNKNKILQDFCHHHSQLELIILFYDDNDNSSYTKYTLEIYTSKCKLNVLNIYNEDGTTSSSYKDLFNKHKFTYFFMHILPLNSYNNHMLFEISGVKDKTKKNLSELKQIVYSPTTSKTTQKKSSKEISKKRKTKASKEYESSINKFKSSLEHYVKICKKTIFDSGKDAFNKYCEELNQNFYLELQELQITVSKDDTIVINNILDEIIDNLIKEYQTPNENKEEDKKIKEKKENKKESTTDLSKEKAHLSQKLKVLQKEKTDITNGLKARNVSPKDRRLLYINLQEVKFGISAVYEEMGNINKAIIKRDNSK